MYTCWALAKVALHVEVMILARAKVCLVIFCSDRAYHCCRFYKAVGTNWYKWMMSMGKRLQAVARWAMSKGFLGQFLLAKKQSDWVKGKKRRWGQRWEWEHWQRQQWINLRVKKRQNFLCNKAQITTAGERARKNFIYQYVMWSQQQQSREKKKVSLGFFWHIVAIFPHNIIEHLD